MGGKHPFIHSVGRELKREQLPGPSCAGRRRGADTARQGRRAAGAGGAGRAVALGGRAGQSLAERTGQAAFLEPNCLELHIG